MKSIKIWRLGLFAAFFLVPCQVQSSEIVKKTATKAAIIFKGLATWRVVELADMLVHEAAHAFIAKILYDNPIDITITIGRGSEVIFKLGPVAFRNFNLFGTDMIGVTKIGPSIPSQGAGFASILLAGPLTSILFGIGVQKLSSNNRLLDVLGKYIEINGYLNLLPTEVSDGSLLGQTLIKGSDGSLLCKALNVNKYLMGAIISSVVGIRLIQYIRHSTYYQQLILRKAKDE